MKLQNRVCSLLCEITYVHVYKDFRQMIEAEGLRHLLPFARSVAEGMRIYECFPGAEGVHRYGAAAIGVKPISSIQMF